MRSFTLFTLGCKVNFYESEWIRERLANLGFIEHSNLSPCPEWVIINTCTVTNRADRQSRQIIYQTARKCPNARIVVTGCYADREPETIKALPNVRHVFSNSEKPQLIKVLASAPTAPLSEGWMTLNSFKKNMRAYLMVQNGCNAHCAYCIIPTVRGKSRSKPISVILKELDALGTSGHPEVVLTGIHLGLYGRDLSPPRTLSDLIVAIDTSPFSGRVRLSSLEPMELDHKLIETIAASEKICRHLHVPLQNGDEEILRRMRRPYTPEKYERLIATLRSAMPDCAIGSDIMVGFPGETDASFERGYRLIERLPFAYLHVFPYSDRPGTVSQAFPDKVPERIKKARAARLRALSGEKRQVFFASWVGKMDEVVFEQQKASHLWEGKSAHYLPVRVRVRQNILGGVRKVTITSVDKEFVWGELSGRAS